MTQNIAVLGCGGWGTNIVRSVAAIGALAAVSDPNAEAARRHAEQHGVRAMSLDDLLAAPDIAGVMIAAPAHLHYELAVKVIEAGKDAYVEKPLTLTTADGRRLVALAQERGRILMVGHLLQYHPAFIRLRELVAAGTLGRLVNIYSHRLNMGKIRREEDVLWSFAPHDISMILALAGDSPTKVTSVKMPVLHPTISDTTISHLEFASGLKAHIHVSWLNPLKEQRLVVVGDAAMAVFDDRQGWDSKLALYRHRVEWLDGAPKAVAVEPEYVALAEAQPLINECQHFVDCIRTRQTPRTDGREGLAVLAVLEQASPLAPAQARVLPEGTMIHETAVVDDNVDLGAGVKIWHFSHILGGSTIGEKTSIGQNVVIGPDVTVGARCKIQNNVSLYKGVELADGVFCGPSCVFTNVVTPRAEYERKNEFAATPVGRGASIGANATIVCGHSIGDYALVAAGAVVTRNVKRHSLVAGVPARHVGWVSHAGRRLGDDLVCPEEGRRYRVTADEELEEISAGAPAA